MMVVRLIHQKIEGAQPVAMHFGNEVITLPDLAQHIVGARHAYSKAIIIAALDYGLVTEKSLREQHRWLTHELLGEWRKLHEVARILRVAGAVMPQSASKFKGNKRATLVRRSARFGELDLKTALMQGHWSLFVADKVVCHQSTCMRLQPLELAILEELMQKPCERLSRESMYVKIEKINGTAQSSTSFSTQLSTLKRGLRTISSNIDPITKEKEQYYFDPNAKPSQ